MLRSVPEETFCNWPNSLASGQQGVGKRNKVVRLSREARAALVARVDAGESCHRVADSIGFRSSQVEALVWSERQKRKREIA